MNIHLPAILMFTRGTRFWHTALSVTATDNAMYIWYSRDTSTQVEFGPNQVGILDYDWSQRKVTRILEKRL